MDRANLRISLNGNNAFRLNLAENATEQIRLVAPVSGSFSGKITVDTTEGWSLNPTYVPKYGEIVIYSDRTVVSDVVYPGIKIGDNNSYVVDLPFFGDDDTNRIITLLEAHVNNASVHVTPAEKSFWNSKLNCELETENLVFTRN